MKLFLYVLTQVCITLVSVCGIYILTGLTGMFSLGSAAFMAIGAYVSGLLVLKAGLNMYAAFAAAIIFSVGIGYVIGFPIVRLRRDYISLVTLGFGESIAQLILLLSQFTGGAFGLIGVPRRVDVWFTLISAVIVIAITAFFKTSKFGRQCIAVKSDELAAQAMGINIIHFGMIVCISNVIGTMTPPVAVNIFSAVQVTRSVRELKIGDIAKAELPFFLGYTVVFFLCVFSETFCTFLVR